MKFETADDAFDYIGTFMNFERSRKQTIRDYRLDRMRKLLSHFGNPQNDINIIHIAGSKGKGSTGVLAAASLSAMGLKTGLYTSPHIVTYRERITLAGQFFPDEVYIRTVERIAENIESFKINSETGSSEATTFELLTLMAFLIFKESGCSWSVIETGIGGRLDATNVVFPKAVIITRIEKEHTDILGNTIQKIAAEKAGIIKNNVPVFSGYQSKEVLTVLREKANILSTPFITLDSEFSSITAAVSRSQTTVSCLTKDNKTLNFSLQLIGNVQAENAALAWMCLNYLKELITPDRDSAAIAKKIAEGFRKATLPGRFEIIGTTPSFIFDGAHTTESVKRVVESYREIFGNKGILIFGSVAGKDSRGMAEILTSLFTHIIISTPGTFKESNPEDVFNIFKNFRSDIILEKDPDKAVREAHRLSVPDNLPILVTGSFYMAGEIRTLVVKDRQER